MGCGWGIKKDNLGIIRTMVLAEQSVQEGAQGESR